MPDLVYNVPNVVKHSRACRGCIKAKRRCDLQSPSCNRCLSKGLECSYINQPLSSHIRATKSQPSVTSQTLVRLAEKSKDQDPPTEQDSAVASSAITLVSLSELSAMETIETIDMETFDFLAGQFRNTPSMFANSERTPFSRRDVFEFGYPQHVNEVHALCKSYLLCQTPGQAQNIVSALDQAVDTMISKVMPSSSSYQGYEDIVVVLQALLIALCVLVLSASHEARINAKRFEKQLHLMTSWLWTNAPAYLSSDMNPRRAFIVGESIRRTLLTSFIFDALWSIARRGWHTHGPFIEALPFDQRTWLFDGINSPDGGWVADYKDGFDEPSKLLSYREYSDAWELKPLQRQLSAFEEMLLVACKGRNRVRSRNNTHPALCVRGYTKL